MINKKGVWFLTLFSLILVLSIYYITMPPELLIANYNRPTSNNNSTPVARINESTILVALRVQAEERVDSEISNLKKIISDSESSLNEKNRAFEKIRELTTNRSIEGSLEAKIQRIYNLKSFITINSNNIDVIVSSSEYDDVLANNIMRSIQEEFDTAKNITVKFQK